MLHDREWIVAHPGTLAVFADRAGNRVAGFIELVDPNAGLAWIREQSTGERRMITRADYPRAVSD